MHDNIAAERLLKADLTTTVYILYDLFYVIWDNDTVPPNLFVSQTHWPVDLVKLLYKKASSFFSSV